MTFFPLEILSTLLRNSRTAVIGLFTEEASGSEGLRLCLKSQGWDAGEPAR